MQAREMLDILLPLRDTLPERDKKFLDSWQQALERGRDLTGKRLTFLRRMVEDVSGGQLVIKK